MKGSHILLVAFAVQIADAQTDNATGNTAADVKAEDVELVKKTLNPVSSLVSVPIQNNWDFGIGPADAMRYTANIQPVLPFSLNQNWNLISRTMPVINQEPRFTGDGSYSGLGDILQSVFLSPKDPLGGWILGGGPALLFPTSTDSVLGAGKWGSVPINFLVTQLLKVGNQPLSLNWAIATTLTLQGAALIGDCVLR